MTKAGPENILSRVVNDEEESRRLAVRKLCTSGRRVQTAATCR